MKVLVLVVLCFSAQYCLCERHRHLFTANTNFDNTNRWLDAEHGYPCAGDTIEFSPDEAISVFVQTDATISELILPMNGEFIFGEGVVWGVSEEISPCSDVGHSHAVHYSSKPDGWYKTSNWEVRNADGDLLGRQDLLDIEQVPCQYDDAEFPETNSFTSNIAANSQLRSLSIGKAKYDTPGFVDYRDGKGKYQFVGDGKITIDGNGCRDVTGCLCRLEANLEPVLQEICRNIECPVPSCENPIFPLGSCCKKCGATLSFNYTESYAEQTMVEHLRTLTADPQYSGTHATLSKVTTDMRLTSSLDSDGGLIFTEFLLSSEPAIQILITDEGTDAKSGTIAKTLAEKLYDELATPDNAFGVSNIEIHESGAGTSSSMHAGTIAAIVIGSVFGLAILGLILFALRSAVIVVPNAKVPNPITIASRHSAPLRGKKYRMTFELSDDNASKENLPNVTEVGPGLEFESTDDNPNVSKSYKYGSTVQNIGWPQRSAMDSDFGIAFGNPAYNDEDV